ncbi:MAG: potassium channel protein [Sphingomonas sp.]|nr:potassium channel protein [Sphingomonas sp.]
MARSPRRRIVKLGGFQAVQLGAPPPTADLYYWIMEMSWAMFIALVTAVFVGVNFLFGVIYALLPGAIANAEPGSLLDGFYFSVDTLATVGYGTMSPATRIGHALAVIEIMIGLFFSATITGLIFARFARPRDSVMFSRIAVIGRYDGQPALMIRVASIRPRPMFDASAQMSWLERVDLPDGRTYRRLVELPLVRARNPSLGLAWTLVHMLDDHSPVLAALAGDGPFTLTASVNGLDTLLANQTQGSVRYARDDVRVDHEFVDVILDIEGVLHVDLMKMHDSLPIAVQG